MGQVGRLNDWPFDLIVSIQFLNLFLQRSPIVYKACSDGDCYQLKFHQMCFFIYLTLFPILTIKGSYGYILHGVVLKKIRHFLIVIKVGVLVKIILLKFEVLLKMVSKTVSNSIKEHI